MQHGRVDEGEFAEILLRHDRVLDELVSFLQHLAQVQRCCRCTADTLPYDLATIARIGPLDGARTATPTSSLLSRLSDHPGERLRQDHKHILSVSGRLDEWNSAAWSPGR